MRKYIDAEKLKQEIWQYTDKYGQIMLGITKFNILLERSAADVAEVKRGRWVNVEPAPNNLFYATCSVCGDRQTVEVANYCPMCGASMDEEEK